MSRFIILSCISVLGLSLAFGELPMVARIEHAEAFAAAPALNTEDYDIKFGNIITNVGTSFEVEYNDNINQVDTGAESDTIFRFGLNSATIWPITELNALTLDLNFGYRFYARHPEIDSNRNFLDVNPGSEIALKWWIKNFEFKAYDRFQYIVNSADTRVYNTATSTVDGNIIDLATFENRAGLQAVWDLNDLKVYAGYARDDVRAEDEDYKTIDRTTHTVYLSPLFLLNPELSVGLMSAYSWNNYRRDYLNDGTSFAIGPSASWQMTENTLIAADLYWKRMQFDETATVSDTTDPSDLNGHFRIAQDLNSAFSHALEYARETDLGSATNATVVDAVYYLPLYQLNEDLALKGRFGFEHSEDSGVADNETFNRRVFGGGFTYTLSEKLRSDFLYTYSSSTSNIEDRSYNQNRLVLNLSYDF